MIGLSKCAWYYSKQVGRKRRGMNHDVSDMVQKIGRRPTYGTRRMAHQITRQTGTPVNYKQIQRIYRILGWIEPRKTRSAMIKSASRPLKPTGPNKL